MSDQAFAHWMRLVDNLLISKVGLTHRDIADQTWRDWHEDELQPIEAVYEALANEGMVL